MIYNRYHKFKRLTRFGHGVNKNNAYVFFFIIIIIHLHHGIGQSLLVKQKLEIKQRRC